MLGNTRDRLAKRRKATQDWAKETSRLMWRHLRLEDPADSTSAEYNALENLIRHSRGAAELAPELARAKVLTKHRDTLRRRRSAVHGLTNIVFALVLAGLMAAVIMRSLLGNEAAGLAASLVAVLFVAGLVCRQRYWELCEELLPVDNEFDRLKVSLQSDERRALKLLQNHSLELRRYYGQALRHASFIFWIGVLCLVLGFGLVIAAITLIVNESGSAADRDLVAALGLVSGIMSNFIGVIYLRIYSQTIAALSSFHNRLVTTNHLHFANFLAAKVDETHQADTLAQMAVALAAAAPSAMANGSNPQVLPVAIPPVDGAAASTPKSRPRSPSVEKVVTAKSNGSRRRDRSGARRRRNDGRRS